MARILVVDDNPDMLQMLDMVLSSRGNHEVLLSGDGQDGLTKALSENPDLAIVDVMMPEMNGYDVVRRVRANPRTAKMSIIILTARGQPVDKTAALEAGADAHMSKPVNMKELLELVENLLNPKRLLSKKGVLPVFSLRGGIGVSTIAVNLALLLQQVDSTVLVDLSPNSGHCALYLGLKPKHHWGLYLKNPTLHAERLLTEHPSGLRVLASPPYPLQDEFLTREHMTKILEDLQSITSLIVVDMPPMFTPDAVSVLDQADQIILVSGDDPPGIQTTMLTLRALKDQSEQIRLVLNDTTPGPRPPMEAVQSALKMSIVSQIPYDPAQTTALRRGTPVVQITPPSPLATGMHKLAQTVLQSE